MELPAFFQNIPEISRMLEKILELCGTFSKILVLSILKYWNILKHSRNLGNFKGLLEFLENLSYIRKMFGIFQRNVGTLQNILKNNFQKSLELAKTFRKLFKKFRNLCKYCRQIIIFSATYQKILEFFSTNIWENFSNVLEISLENSGTFSILLVQS